MPPSEKIYLPHITSAKIVYKGWLKKQTILQFQGELPSPAFAFAEPQFTTHTDTLTISPQLNYDGQKIVIQMAIHFEHEIDITDHLRNITQVQLLSDGRKILLDLQKTK